MNTIEWLRKQIAPLCQQRADVIEQKKSEPDETEKRSLSGKQAALTRKIGAIEKIIAKQTKFKGEHDSTE